MLYMNAEYEININIQIDIDSTNLCCHVVIIYDILYVCMLF